MHENSFQGEAGEGKGARENRINVKGEYVTGAERANSFVTNVQKKEGWVKV